LTVKVLFGNVAKMKSQKVQVSGTRAIDAARQIIRKRFSKIIGQSSLKERLEEILLGAVGQKGYLPSIGIFAAPGLGKTKVLKIVQDCIIDLRTEGLLEKKIHYFERGLDVGGIQSFFVDLLCKEVHDKDAIVSIDEAQELQEEHLHTIRTCLEITVARQPKLVRRFDKEILFDPSRHSFILGTNEWQKMCPALRSRLNKVYLEYYNDEELEQIMFLETKDLGIRFAESTLHSLAVLNRGNPRDIVNLLDDVRARVAIKGVNSINKEDVRHIIKARGIYPLGVTQLEMRTLLTLRKQGQAQLQFLAASNQVDSKEQKEAEKYLLQRGLVKVEGFRKLTSEGRKYLADLREDGYIS
jgi:Holliday junction resolvasome RuvABC ATP-dependent DNA helicase subunit